jgi:hypothetical protein
VIVREYRADDESACRALFEELVEVHRRLYPDAEIGADFTREGRLLVAETLAPRDRRPGETLGGREFRV